VEALAGLVRKPAPWDGKWWGTQPVRRNSRPANPVAWAATPLVTETVRALLIDPDAVVAAAAVEAAVAVRDPGAAAELVAVFSRTADPATKRAVLRALAGLPATAAGTDLVAGVLATPGENPD